MTLDRRFIKAISIVLAFIFVGFGGEALAKGKYRHSKRNAKWHAYHQKRGHLHRHGRVVKRVPSKRKRIIVRGAKYYYHRGIFYRPGPWGYMVVGAPIGARVRRLPPAYIKVRVGPVVYFYHYGAFYKRHRRKGRYVVVRAPIGAVVPVLPEGYRTIYVRGETYYFVNGVYYHPTYLYGDLRYVVVKAGFWGPMEYQLSDRDHYLLSQNVQRALEHSPSGKTVAWRNPDSRHRGTVTPESSTWNDDGQFCRNFEQTITVDGETQRARGTACRKDDGTWQVLP